MTLRGRGWVGLWLLIFLVVTAGVVTRQTSAVVAAGELRALQEERQVLEADKNAALRRILEARSRSRLVPRAESLGLRMAADSEVVNFDPGTGGR